ncbi:MAG: class IV adenylate cyclase [Ginsengibacter sp.]
MSHINFEFKARVEHVDEAEQKLLQLNPTFIGMDLQTDTYFKVNQGRLKLREGNIENSLIYYDRQNLAGAKQSDIILYKHQPEKALKAILTKVHGVKVIVKKQRKIYFIENVKFHFDKLAALGEFLEVEAIDPDDSIGIDKLKEQCDYYAKFFNIEKEDYLSESYSDMINEF